MTEISTAVEAMLADQLRRRVDTVIARLGDLTARVEHRRDDIALTGGPGRPLYANVAADIIHEINTTLMNLNLGGLVTAAADADVARTKGE
ncbi:hypothetical protein [Verrucosispora sp. WMMC514]|uniref:hypothetical protein n=1 Tax=Verrucosispora sp. WMMC514 TaxID=3015156 RepID=UPI00248B6A87|nr:hypothetical protein [Verrucosispora sp. WMMC514]WBB94141.1 hypothetical protein O7597_14930 [Verrucosispora sp. WMMC514]